MKNFQTFLNEENKEVVYVVFEEDRGAGTNIIGVYRSKEKAEKVASESSHYYVDKADLE